MSTRIRTWSVVSACGRSQFGDTPDDTTAETCRRCVVRDPCLQQALRRELSGQHEAGIAGGLSSDERQSVLQLLATDQITLDL